MEKIQQVFVQKLSPIELTPRTSRSCGGTWFAGNFNMNGCSFDPMRLQSCVRGKKEPEGLPMVLWQPGQRTLSGFSFMCLKR